MEMKLMNKSNISKIFLLLAALCTTLYLLMLGWFNSLSLDDYGFAVDIRQFTPWEWTKHMYMTWQGRFSDFFISGFVFKCFSGISTFLFPWTVIQLLIGYVVVYLCVRDVLYVRNMGLAITLSVLINNICILSVFELSTFYWLCCAAYFLEAYATILLCYVLFIPKWNMYVRLVAGMLSALFVSGCAENYTPLVLMVLGIIWLIRIVDGTKVSSFVTAFRANSMLFVVCAILAIGFLAMVLAPGNKVRMQNGNQIVGFMHDFSLMPFVKKTIIANSIFFLRLLSRSLYFLAALPLFFYLGMRLKSDGEEMNVESFWKHVGIASILLLGLLFVAVTACVYGIGYYPPLRAMSFVSYIVMIYIGYVGIGMGYKYGDKMMKATNILLVLTCIGWICFAVYECQKEYPVVKEYHSYIQQRDSEIRDLAEQGSTLPYYAKEYMQPQWYNTYSYLRTFMNKCHGSKKVVNEPYFPYMISALDQTNPNDFKNKGLGDYYNAKFDILTR